MNRFRTGFTCGFLGLALLLSSSSADSLTYSVTDLGTLNAYTSIAWDINNRGQVVGSSGNAFLYNGGSMTDLSVVIGGRGGSAQGINNAGQIVGWYMATNEWTNRAFLYSDGMLTDIGSLGGYQIWANAINDAGQIVGWSGLYGRPGVHAFLYANGAMTDIGTLGGNSSEANDINNRGQIVGLAHYSGGDYHPFLYSEGVMTDLGSLGGRRSAAYGINDNGQVVGASSTPTGDWHAFLWHSGTMTDIDPAGVWSRAVSINNRGEVVGFFGPNSDWRAFLYSNGEMVDLNTLIPSDSGWVLRQASAINDAGQIVGEGIINGLPHAFLLTPEGGPPLSVPEPSTLLLFSTGLLSIGLAIKRLNGKC